MKRETRVTINISGEIFETYAETLQRFPETLLGNPEKRRRFLSKNCYFFQRHRKSFDAILFYYQSFGNLRRPYDVDMLIFESECRFFEISECAIVIMKSKEGFVSLKEVKKHEFFENQSFRTKIWQFMENPSSSTAAEFYAYFSLFLIVLSVVAACLETVPELNVDAHGTSKDPWALLELSLNSFFLMELLLVFLAFPRKTYFFRSAMNWVDIVAIIPYFVSYAVNKEISLGFLRLLRLIRIFKLFRLSKQFEKLRVALHILKDCLKDLQLFVLCMFIIVVCGASLMYFIEKNHHATGFTSVPQGMWWSVQTLVTLGYGDIIPVTSIGKAFSCVYMLFGTLTISLPVLSVVIKFTNHWALSTDEDKDNENFKWTTVRRKEITNS